MLKFVRVGLCAAVALSGTVPGAVPPSMAQDPPRQKTTQDTFFSGNVVSITAEKVTVSRRTISLSAVTKVFLLDAATQIEGKLKVKARVTVKFEKTEDGERAVHIIVRN